MQQTDSLLANCYGLGIYFSIINFLKFTKMTPRNKKIIQDSERENIPILVFIAKDKLAMNALADYYHICLASKCNQEFMADLNARIAEFRTWQHANPDRVKVPD